MDKPQIRNVLATSAGQSGVQWVCQPMELGIDDRICGVMPQASAQAIGHGMLQLSREDPVGYGLIGSNLTDRKLGGSP